MQRARQDLTEGKVKDAASGARNLETVAGISTDKLLVLRDQPTQVVAHRHTTGLGGILEDLMRIIPPKHIDGEAHEIPPAA